MLNTHVYIMSVLKQKSDVKRMVQRLSGYIALLYTRLTNVTRSFIVY
jgi:hypothetical protein